MAERDDLKDSSGTRSAEQIRRDIAATRETISSTVDTLGERLHEKLDWRGYIARYPYASLGAAAGLGLATGYMLRRKRSPFDRVVDAVTDSIEDAGDRIRSAVTGALTKVGGRGLVKGTVYGLVGRLAINWLKSAASQALHSDSYYEESPAPAGDVPGAAWAARNNPQPSSTRPV